MNLEAASTQHRNVVISFSALLTFAMFNDMNPESGKVIAIVWGLFIYHWASLILLGKHLEKNMIIWTVSAIASPFLLLIPTAILIISANKTFKNLGWRVKFYGRAEPKKTNSPKNKFSDNTINSHIDRSDTKKCCHCAEDVKYDAVICRYCGLDPDQEKIKKYGITFDGKKYNFLSHQFSKRSDALKYAELKSRSNQKT